MGRPRTPTALKLVKGTAQPCRTNANEPTPERGIPPAPAHLSPRALTAWPAIGELLDGMGVLTRADALALEGLCSTYAELVDARKTLAERGATSYKSVSDAVEVGQDDEGKPIYEEKFMWRAFPEVAMVADLDRRFQSWLAKVGLTPADRSKVSAIGDGAGEADPWSSL